LAADNRHATRATRSSSEVRADRRAAAPSVPAAATDAGVWLQAAATAASAAATATVRRRGAGAISSTTPSAGLAQQAGGCSALLEGYWMDIGRPPDYAQANADFGAVFGG
jgi:hypothetical protein